jgi:hypothetical protein
MKKAMLYMLASLALLMTGVMTDPPADTAAGQPAPCPMAGNTDVVCGRPGRLHCVRLSFRIPAFRGLRS